VIVFGNRPRVLETHPRIAILVGVSGFEEAPAKVCACGSVCRQEIDFLPLILTDIAYVQVACGTIKGEAPGIAQPVSPDFMQRLGGELIIGRDGIGLAAINIQAQDLA